MVHGFNKCINIPKILVIVLEDAIINDINADVNYGIANNIEIRTKWLISQYRKIIDAFLDYLPMKCKRDTWPQMLFVVPSLHCNYRNNNLRKKFMRILEDTCACSERATAMRLRNGWDYDDTNIFLESQQRYSTEGLASFWHATDKLIEEFDQTTFLSTSGTNDRKPDYQRNDYSWQSPAYIQARRGGRGGKNYWRGARF